jgi:hypothetical protein
MLFVSMMRRKLQKKRLRMNRNKLRKKPYIKHICAVHVYEICLAKTVLWKRHLYTLHINI